MKQYGWILIICFCAFVQKNYAQDFPDLKFSLLAPFNNLPAGSVNTVYKDRQGLMWIGTENNGLLRFDGKKIKSYHSTGNKPNGIPSNYIGRICEDKQGWLWISTLPGLYRLNPVTEEIETYLHNESDSNSIATNNKPIPFVDSKGHVWVASNKGLQLFNPANKKFSNYTTAPIANPAWQLHAKGIGMLYEDRNHRIWAGSAYGLYLIDTISHGCIPYFTGDYIYVSDILQDHQGQLWVSFWGGGVKKFFPETGNYVDFFKPGSVVRFLKEWEDEQHKKWICFAEDNFTLLDPVTGKYSYYKQDNTTGIIDGSFINYIYKDNEERLWIMTNKGINIMDPSLQLFKNHSLQPAIKKFNLNITNTGIPNAFLKTPDGYLVSGWYNGYLYKLTTKWEVTKVIKKLSPLATSDYPRINSMQYDDEGNIWYATDSCLIKQSTNKRIRYFIPQDSFSQLEGKYTANEILKRPDGFYWSRFESRGLYIFDAKVGKFYKNYRNQYNGIATSTRFDREGTLWLGTSSGLYCYDKKSDSFKLMPLYKTKTVSNELYHTINDIYFDESNTGWIATSYGLVKLATKDKKAVYISDLQKAPHYNAYKLLQDSTGIIWILSDNGIRIYNKKTGQFRYFSSADGLPEDFTGSNKMFNWANDSTIATGNINTITTFNPYKLNNDKPDENIVFTDISIDENRYVFHDTSTKKISIIAPPGTKKISIHFALLNYTAPQQNRLYYRLANGESGEWIESKEGDINLLDLSAGEYQLQVKASSNESVITDVYNSISINIKYFWYQSGLWKIIFIVFFAISLYAFIRWRILSVKNAAAVKQYIAETEMAALKAQMNPHFMFNCINSIDSFIQTNDKYNATLYLNKFAKLIRNVLDSSKQNLVTFSKDIETLKLYVELEELRSESKFTTQFSIDEELMNSDYKVPPLIIQPFVENAIIHGLRNKETNDGLLLVTITKENDHIKYNIKDNGIGRKEAGTINTGKEKSYGMEMSFDRVKLFNKEEKASVRITDLYENEKPAGTMIEVQLKIK